MGLIRIDRHPSRRQLKVFGLLWLIFAGALGWIVLDKSNSVWAAAAVWMFAAGVPVVGTVVPGFLRIIYLGMAYAAFPIGWILSHVILALVYYGVMTPTGLLMWLIGYDPMRRKLDHEAETYWIQREETDDVGRYFRQY